MSEVEAAHSSGTGTTTNNASFCSRVPDPAGFHSKALETGPNSSTVILLPLISRLAPRLNVSAPALEEISRST